MSDSTGSTGDAAELRSTADASGNPVAPQSAPQSRPAPAWRRVVDGVQQFDRGGLRLLPGLRIAVATAIPLSIGYATGSWAAGAGAAGGALSVGISSVVPSTRPRIAVLTSTAAAIAFGTFLGSWTNGYATPHVIVVAAFSFACGLLVAVEPAAMPVGLNALVGFFVYGRSSATFQTALQTAGLVAAGGLFQVVVTVLAHRRPLVGRALTGLAGAYRALAAYATDLVIGTSSLPVGKAIDAAASDLEFSLVSGASGDAGRSLTGEARRVRLELLSLASARSVALQAQDPDADLLAGFEALASKVSGYLAAVAEGLATAEVPGRLAAALSEAERAVDQVRGATTGPDDGPGRRAGARLTSVRAATAAAALAGQLRAIAALVPEAVDASRTARTAALRSAGRVSRRGARGAGAIVERMTANLTWRSDAFQHALRLTAVVAASSVVAHLVGISRGYWVALTAVLVLRPEFSVTFTRGLGRALGTLLGVGVASAIAAATHPRGWLLVAFVGVFVFLAGAVFNASYAIFSVAITGVVVFLLAGVDRDPAAIAPSRLLATVLGAALALGAYAVWPAWGRRRVADAVADLADATRGYVDVVLRGWTDPSSKTSANPVGAREVRLARTNAESAIERSLGDPTSRRIDRAATMELLADYRRLALAAHSLRFPSPVGRSPSALRDLQDALDTELAAIAARLRFGRVTVVRQPLRERHRRLADALATRDDDKGRRDVDLGRLLLAESDEMVDATNSLADLLERNSGAVTGATSRDE